MISIEFIYALHTGDKEYFYVGRSDRIRDRIKEHIRDADHNGTKKEKRIAELLDAGHEIVFDILESGTASEMIGKEDVWITNLKSEGYDLTNSKGGDTCYLPSDYFDLGESSPWTVEEFVKADWKKGLPKAKSGEWSAWIKGIQFFRTGSTKLRFWHPTYQIVDVFAAGGIEDKYKKAIKMLTPGEPENLRMIQQHHQAVRMKM